MHAYRGQVLRAHRGPVLAVTSTVLACTLVTACTSEGVPTPPATTRGPELAQCRPFGKSSAPVALKLPGLVQYQIRPLPSQDGTGPRLAMRAVDEETPGKTVNASVSLYDGPASKTPAGIRSGIYVANIDEAAQWQVKNVDEGEISTSAMGATVQATDIRHSTFTAGPAASRVTFDYWAFTASGHRYLLSYARTAAAKTPEAAAYFATATSCPKST